MENCSLYTVLDEPFHGLQDLLGIKGINRMEQRQVEQRMGSGTTAVACKELGLNYIGSEISKNQCEWAEKRLARVVFEPQFDFGD